MSVVVYHRGVMAADSRAYSGSSHPAGNKMKIHRVAAGPFEGSLLGITSNVVGMPERFKAWLEQGAKQDAWTAPDPCFEAILVQPNGHVFLFSGDCSASGPLVGETFTIGSGKGYALGAIKMGADAVRAAEIAIECDTWCGGPVTAIPLHNAPVEPDIHLPDFSTSTTISA